MSTSSMTRGPALDTERCISVMSGLVFTSTSIIGQGRRPDKGFCSGSSTSANITGRKSGETCTKWIGILCAGCMRGANDTRLLAIRVSRQVIYASECLTLSLRSSTMLLSGAGFPAINVDLLAGVAAPLSKGAPACSPGLGGVESPNTAVLGKKRLAMTTRWFLSVAIV